MTDWLSIHRGEAPLVGCHAECLHLEGDRAAIRAQTVAVALQRLLEAAHAGGL